MTCPDLAEALQVRILAHLKAGRAVDAVEPDPRRGVGALEAHIATLETAVVGAETLREQLRWEAETATKRVEILEAKIAVLEKAVATAEALGEQRRQEAETATKRADGLVAELVEITNELLEMSKRMTA